ncbi:MAG: bifunctional serine/threonine-protein kinase/formylglycine-generating enzyme family protein [Planctomycetota bacterium]
MDSLLARCERVFQQARALDPADREEFLAAACAGAPELRAQVEACLRAAERSSAMPSGSLLEVARQRAVATALPDVAGFEVLYRLGRGGGGTVFLARQTSLLRRVALKLYTERVLPSPKAAARLHREAQIVASLGHPNIVKVFEHGEVGGTHWFAMEFVEGHDLDTELRFQREGRRAGAWLPPFGGREHVDAVVGLVATVADALEHAHRQGVVHRDVKPANILLERDTGRVVLTDFGLALNHFGERLTSEGDVLGTLRYMAPEQWVGGPVDARADVFALGLVLYEALGGEPPFGDDAARPASWEEPRSLRRANRAVPVELELVCRQALRRLPAERYASAAAFRDDLRAVVRGDPIRARRLPPWRALALMLRRRPIAAALALGVLAAALVLVLAWPDRRPSVGVGLRFVGRPVEAATVRIATLDPRTCDTEALTASLDLPLGRRSLDAGYYRFCVRLASGELREYTRVVTPDVASVQRFAFDVYPLPTGAAGASAVAVVAGGRVSLEAGMPHGLERAVEVATFAIERTEVSNAQFRRFLAETGRQPPVGFDMLTSAHDDLPVGRIGWEDARAYAEWCGRRLPSFAEWALAARGPHRHRYPRGGDSCSEANTERPLFQAIKLEDQFRTYVESVRRVQDCPAAASTPNGLLHVLGNVAEWTEAVGCNRVGTGWVVDWNLRLVAGGDWKSASYTVSDLTTVDIASIFPAEASYARGFRCLQPLPQD